MLRDPVDRAWSHYCHAVKHWGDPKYRTLGYPEETLRFEDAIEAEPERLRSGEFHNRHQSYFTKGLYADQLAWYLERFAREQMHVLLLEDMADDSERALAGVCRFLGVAERAGLCQVGRMNAASRGTCPPEVRARLVRRYLPSIERLEVMLGRDLGAWKR